VFRRCSSVVLLGLIPFVVRGQFPVHENDRAKVEALLDGSPRGDALKCEVSTFKPFVDFALRFEVGYLVQCPIDQFDGKETGLTTLIRIRQSGSQPVLLADYAKVPALPSQLDGKVNVRRLHNWIEYSGVFAVGEGEYPVDFMVKDHANRFARKRWTVHARLHGKEQQISVGLPPNTARSVALSPWNNKDERRGSGLRLTVLLDAAPINPSDSKLRAWDRAFLLGALTSLLREVNCASVKLIAFNLDQNREIFRQENLDHAGFRKLAHSLQQLELGTVSYRVIQNEYFAPELPLKLVRDEISNSPAAADAVVFLGPNARMRSKIAKEELASVQSSAGQKLPIFYFEYFPAPGSEFPDTIHSLTAGLNGTVLKLHSPGDLAEGIARLQKRLEESGVSAACPATAAESPE